MDCATAASLLGDQGKYFSEVVHIYNFKDDALLKDYLDFAIHEPVEWLRGFPAKYTTKVNFGKPKTAIIKLLKQKAVIEALGEEYIKTVHDAIWVAFKQNSDAILEKRQGGSLNVLEQLVEPHLVVEELDGERVLPSAVDKGGILAAALRAMIDAQKEVAPGLSAAATILLDALESA